MKQAVASAEPKDVVAHRGNNHLRLVAKVIERSPLRYTPAGLPALDVVLRHIGQAVEAATSRQVVLEIKAKAIGSDLVRKLQGLTGDAVCTGFLASARNGRGVVFHLATVAEAEPIDDSSSSQVSGDHHAPSPR